MSTPEDDPTAPQGPGDKSELGDMGADLQAALGDLLGGDEPAAPGEDDLDLSMLEDAVAELGLDVGNRGAEPTQAPEPRANPGLDLTELPPPPGRAADAPAPPPPATPPAAPAPAPSMFSDPAPAPVAPPARKLPPLGQASAEDLFGDLGEDDDFGVDWDSPPPTPEESREPSAGEPSADEAAPAPIQLPAPDGPPPPAARPTTDEVVAYAAHRGRLSGEITSKARKLFGR